MIGYYMGLGGKNEMQSVWDQFNGLANYNTNKSMLPSFIRGRKYEYEAVMHFFKTHNVHDVLK